MAKTKSLYTVLVPLTLLLWGTEYTLVGLITPHMAEAWQVCIRMIFAAVFMCAFIYIRGHALPTLRDASWLWYGLMGFVGMTIPFYLIAKGYSAGVDSGLISILIGVTPLFTVILAHFFVRSEPLTPLKLLGFIIGFIGVIILFMPKNLSWALVDNWQAQAMIIFAAFGYAATSILGKRAPEQPASVGAALMLIGGALSATIGALALARTNMPQSLPPMVPLLALIALIFGATFLGNLLYLRLLQLRGPSLIAKINYLVPFIALVFGIVFLHESFQARYLISLIIILLGLFIANLGEAQTQKNT